jgi:hypothetical protein
LSSGCSWTFFGKEECYNCSVPSVAPCVGTAQTIHLYKEKFQEVCAVSYEKK